MTPSLLPHLVAVAVELRTNAGLKDYDIASRARASPDTVNRFEAGKGWPTKLDDLLAGYADAGGTTVADIYARALARMAKAEQAAGENPVPLAASDELRGLLGLPPSRPTRAPKRNPGRRGARTGNA